MNFIRSSKITLNFKVSTKIYIYFTEIKWFQNNFNKTIYYD